MADRILKYAGLARQALNVTIRSRVFLLFVYPILTRLCVALVPMCSTAHASVRSQLGNKYRTALRALVGDGNTCVASFGVGSSALTYCL